MINKFCQTCSLQATGCSSSTPWCYISQRFEHVQTSDIPEEMKTEILKLLETGIFPKQDLPEELISMVKKLLSSKILNFRSLKDFATTADLKKEYSSKEELWQNIRHLFVQRPDPYEVSMVYVAT